MQWACHNPAMLTFVAALACAIALDAAPDVLVSRQLAARAHLTVGDTVTLAADANGTRARTFRVAGIYEPTPDPMRFTAERIEGRLHLPDLIALTADPHDPASTESVKPPGPKGSPADAVTPGVFSSRSSKFSR